MTEGGDHARARFRQLVERALFELRLAGDIAAAEGYGPAASAPLDGARRSLRRCLDAAGAPPTRTAGAEDDAARGGRPGA